MNNRKHILYILLIVLGLVLVYNYMVAPVLMQYNTPMGMHRRMYASTNYFVDVRFILLIGVAIAGLLLFEFLRPQTKSSKCSKCGKEIEENRWKICPICGNSLEYKKG
ncbi:MAG: hypothetical protein ACOYWZ_11840 [Bacillota bacterium]